MCTAIGLISGLVFMIKQHLTCALYKLALSVLIKGFVMNEACCERSLQNCPWQFGIIGNRHTLTKVILIAFQVNEESSEFKCQILCYNSLLMRQSEKNMSGIFQRNVLLNL